jgi:hypothetical protein
LFSPSISIAEALDLANTPDAIAVVLFTTLVLSFSTVGVLIATRQTQNPIGWIMIGGYVDLSLPQGRLPATHAVGSVGFGVGRAARHRPGAYLSLGTDS